MALEHFNSKKWLHSLHFDTSISALFVNQEGKNCPQKIIYFPNRLSERLPEYQCQKTITRQYKLFSETVLHTCSVHINADHLFCAGVNGIVYKLAKKDIARLLHRQKEKLKGNISKKILQIKRASDRGGLKVIIPSPNNPGLIEEDESESYLHSTHTVAISSFAASHDAADIYPRLSPEMWSQQGMKGSKQSYKKDAELSQASLMQKLYMHQHYQPYYLAMGVRDMPLLLVLGQQSLSAHQLHEIKDTKLD